MLLKKETQKSSPPKKFINLSAKNGPLLLALLNDLSALSNMGSSEIIESLLLQSILGKDQPEKYLDYIQQMYEFSTKTAYLSAIRDSMNKDGALPKEIYTRVIKQLLDITNHPSMDIDEAQKHVLTSGSFYRHCQNLIEILNDETSTDKLKKMMLKDSILLLKQLQKEIEGIGFVAYNCIMLFDKYPQSLNNSQGMAFLQEVVALSDPDFWERPDIRIKSKKLFYFLAKNLPLIEK